MKKVLSLALGLALAASAFGYALIYQSGYPCRHESEQMPWTYNYNDRGCPDCANEYTELTTACNTWSNVSNQWYRQVRGSDTSNLNYGYDGDILAVWYEPSYSGYGQGSWPWGSGAIAVTVWWYAYWGGEYTRILHNDTCYNGYNFSWSDAGAGGMMDIQNISAHEFGHNLVLGDIYDGYASEYTMYGYGANGETKKRTLHQDDINGIQFLYAYSGIQLESFTAKAKGGDVEVNWRTSWEKDNAGFNLYRVTDGGATTSCVKVNDALIMGQSPYRYCDAGLAPGSYKYILEAVDLNGYKEKFGPAPVDLGSNTKRTFALASCYPNPARDKATFKFTLPEAGEARLAVYDLSGRRVATPVSGPMAAGEHKVEWRLATENGSRLTPGVYFYRLEATGEVATRRLVVAE